MRSIKLTQLLLTVGLSYGIISFAAVSKPESNFKNSSSIAEFIYKLNSPPQ
jgi:hypothetical protein